VEINCLKINPRIRNKQNHKNPNQALHEDDKKSLKKCRSLKKCNKKIGPCVFLYLYDRRYFGKNISLDILFDIFK